MYLQHQNISRIDYFNTIRTNVGQLGQHITPASNSTTMTLKVLSGEWIPLIPERVRPLG